MIELLVLLIIIIAFLLASYEDIKKREVYDYLNYSLAFIILIIALFDSYFQVSFDPLKSVFIGLVFGFVVGTALFLGGLWGGGDVKFLIAFSGSYYYISKYMGTLVPSFISNINLTEFMVNNIYLNYAAHFFLGLNLLFLVIAFIRLFFAKKEERKDVIGLLLIVLFLFCAIFLNISLLVISLLAFLAFVCLFFIDENILASVYFVRNIDIIKLREGDRVDQEIEFNKKEKIVYEDSIKGLTGGVIDYISKNYNEENSFTVRKRYILPFGILIGINFFLLILKLIVAQASLFTMLIFVLEFIFVSFTLGGILAILILFFTFIRNFKAIELNYTNLEKILVFLLIISTGLVYYLLSDILLSSLLILIVFMLLFMRIARGTEKFMFVSKKDLKDIVPGDWVVEDIVAKNKLVYKKEEFKLGIEEAQIEKIKSLAKKNKELNKILVKDGIAFVPILFLGFIFLVALKYNLFSLIM